MPLVQCLFTRWLVVKIKLHRLMVFYFIKSVYYIENLKLLGIYFCSFGIMYNIFLVYLIFSQKKNKKSPNTHSISRFLFKLIHKERFKSWTLLKKLFFSVNKLQFLSMIQVLITCLGVNDVNKFRRHVTAVRLYYTPRAFCHPWKIS